MPKAAVAREVPPPLELLCLTALWSLGEGTVSNVRQVISRTKPLAYTTVMTLLERLARKGAVSRRKVGRGFVYAPQAPRDAVRRAALKEFLDCFFDGSEDQLLAFLRGAPPAGAPPQPVSPPAAAPDRLDTVLL